MNIAEITQVDLENFVKDPNIWFTINLLGMAIAGIEIIKILWKAYKRGNIQKKGYFKLAIFITIIISLEILDNYLEPYVMNILSNSELFKEICREILEWRDIIGR